MLCAAGERDRLQPSRSTNGLPTNIGSIIADTAIAACIGVIEPFSRRLDPQATDSTGGSQCRRARYSAGLAQGRQTILFGHSAGAIVIQAYAMYHLPYVNLAELAPYASDPDTQALLQSVTSSPFKVPTR